MRARPSKAAETIVGLLIPPACREEVVGDLHERYTSRLGYFADVLSTVPLVILSRIRRTADARIVLMQALALGVAFLGEARINGGVLMESWGLLRLALPAGVVLLGLILEDAYARPGRRPAMLLMRGPMVGVGLARLSQAWLQFSYPELAIPRDVLFYACVSSLALTSLVRVLFPPGSELQGVNAPAAWLKQTGGTDGFPLGSVRTAKFTLALVAIAAIAAWMLSGAHRMGAPETVVIAMIFGVAVYQVWNRR